MQGIVAGWGIRPFFGDDPVNSLNRLFQVKALVQRPVAELGRVHRLAENDCAENNVFGVGSREDAAAASNLAHRELELVLVEGIVVQVVTQVANCSIGGKLD